VVDPDTPSAAQPSSTEEEEQNNQGARGGGSLVRIGAHQRGTRRAAASFLLSQLHAGCWIIELGCVGHGFRFTGKCFNFFRNDSRLNQNYFMKLFDIFVEMFQIQ
jgi:hypothetical protein